jgi:hypothetical protein
MILPMVLHLQTPAHQPPILQPQPLIPPRLQAKTFQQVLLL